MVTNVPLGETAPFAVLASEAPEGKAGSPAPDATLACGMSRECSLGDECYLLLTLQIPFQQGKGFRINFGESVMDLCWRIYSGARHFPLRCFCHGWLGLYYLTTQAELITQDTNLTMDVEKNKLQISSFILSMFCP